ncbi:hypothetical protein EYF80_052083 [Liparis tanakae]|uniref:Uncharacterized protein n=1 Tax=Liparis tanakae TaxID=230148 RepID=A0A4Z2F9Y4_9TELE|nr:hypothetical protein EYF80_052083 [Liparis tanakae]
MEAEDSRAESMEDMTAAATAPMPMTEMYGGVRYCSAMGRMEPAWSRSNGWSACVPVEAATAPTRMEGIPSTRQKAEEA